MPRRPLPRRGWVGGGRAWQRGVAARALFRCSLFVGATMVALLAQHAAALPAGLQAVLPDAGDDQVKVTRFSEGRTLVEYYGNGTRLCESWVLVPGEMMWDASVRGVLYFFGLAYFLLGIAIISDIFMAGIERITSAKEVVEYDSASGEHHTVTVEFWNETVANLTLLALGSSAPEILLSLIESLTTIDEEPGELGASTIVGSAAFNLLIISAVCMYVTEGSAKRVEQFGVFVITTCTSFFAYFWMVVVLVLISDCEVSIGEAITTFLFFPALVLVAWCQDRQWFKKVEPGEEESPRRGRLVSITAEEDGAAPGSPLEGQRVPKRRGSAEEHTRQVEEIWRRLQREGIDVASQEAEEMLSQRANAQLSGGFSKAIYRMSSVKYGSQAIKRQLHVMNSSPPPQPVRTPLTTTQRGASGSAFDNPLFPRSASPGAGDPLSPVSPRQAKAGPKAPLLQWVNSSYTFMENDGHATLVIGRTGPVHETVTVRYATVEGSAKAGKRYQHTEGVAVLEAGQTAYQVRVPLIDDKAYQEEQVFYCTLADPAGGAQLPARGLTKTSVTIIDDDVPGYFEFSVRDYEPSKQTSALAPAGDGVDIEVQETQGAVWLYVQRFLGQDGEVSASLVTIPGTAAPGEDYTHTEVAVAFADGEDMKTVQIPISDHIEYGKQRTFAVQITGTGGGAAIGPKQKANVTIVSDARLTELIARIAGDVKERNMLLKETMQTASSWSEQFREAMTLQVDADEDGDGAGTFLDYVLHFLTLFWKVLFSAVPPPSYAGGWGTFFGALTFIGLVTAVVAELAALFGCVLGVEDGVVAITFVALGTSLPDTFASKTAIENESTADAAIGNVMGSNSVNVFLGLGLPWTIVAIYKHLKGVPYTYPIGGLVFSVILFLCCAMVAVMILVVNRWKYGGEIGGPMRRPFAVALCSLWAVYIFFSVLYIQGAIGGGSSSCSS